MSAIPVPLCMSIATGALLAFIACKRADLASKPVTSFADERNGGTQDKKKILHGDDNLCGPSEARILGTSSPDVRAERRRRQSFLVEECPLCSIAPRIANRQRM